MNSFRGRGAGAERGKSFRAKQEAQLLFHSWNTWLGSQLGGPGGCVWGSQLAAHPAFGSRGASTILLLEVPLPFYFPQLLAPSTTPALPGGFPQEGTICRALFPCFCLFGEINPSCGLPALSHTAGGPNSLSAFSPRFPDTFQSQ